MTEPIESRQDGTEGIAASMLARPAAVSSVEQLVAVRQEAGMSASDVASRLGMATRQIEALERGDWQALPGQAFVRAALRAYGKALRTDVEPLLDSIGGRVSAPELKASASLESPIPRGGGFGFGTGGSNGRLAWIVLGIAAVIAIVFYFGPAFELGDRSARDTVVLAPPAGAPTGEAAGAAGAAGAVTPQTGQSAAADSAGPKGTNSAAAGAGGTAPSSGAPSTAAAPSLSPLAPLAPLVPSGAPAGGVAASGAPTGSAPASSGTQAAVLAASSTSTGAIGASPAAEKAAEKAAAPAVAADSETIRLRFGRESWVEIRESGGKVILTGLQPAGSERELSGRKPLSLVIGNAEHVTLERAGKPFDLAARARQGVARITLD